MTDNAQNLSIYDTSCYSGVSILFMGTVSTDSRRKTPLHYHDFWQLEAGLHSEFTAVTEFGEQKMSPGSILLIPPECRHGFSYPGGLVRWITVKFTFPDPVQGKADFLSPGTFEYRAAELLSDLICDSSLTGNEGRIAAEGLLRSVVGVWVYRYGISKYPYRNIVDVMLEGRKGNPLTVTEAAEEIGCSPAHLSRTFRNLNGVTLKKYIDTSRCAYLLKQLTYTTLTISEIARNTGFPDIYTFSRFVKTQTGKCPRELRREMRDQPRSGEGSGAG